MTRFLSHWTKIVLEAIYQAALLTRYSTTVGFPCSTTKRPAPTKTPPSRSLYFSLPVSNVKWVTMFHQRRFDSRAVTPTGPSKIRRFSIRGAREHCSNFRRNVDNTANVSDMHEEASEELPTQCNADTPASLVQQLSQPLVLIFTHRTVIRSSNVT